MDSDDFEDSLEEIPASPKATKAVPMDDAEDEGGDDEDADDGEGEYVIDPSIRSNYQLTTARYVVEKIQDHMFDEAVRFWRS